MTKKKKVPQEPWALNRYRRAVRWTRNEATAERSKIPPRHIAEVLGWKYVQQPRTGEILHVPGGA
jgi:hypothetical protein